MVDKPFAVANLNNSFLFAKHIAVISSFPRPYAAPARRKFKEQGFNERGLYRTGNVCIYLTRIFLPWQI